MLSERWKAAVEIEFAEMGHKFPRSEDDIWGYVESRLVHQVEPRIQKETFIWLHHVMKNQSWDV